MNRAIDIIAVVVVIIGVIFIITAFVMGLSNPPVTVCG